jgi:glutamate---cysteine ligase / carboxylate-amine ligase
MPADPRSPFVTDPDRNLSAAALQARCEAVQPFTVGIEEEAMLLDPDTLDLAPVADALLERLDGDPRFKPELPAAHLELVTTPTADVPAALAQLAAARADLLAASDGLVRIAAAGTHPFAAAVGALSPGERYDAMREEYGLVGRRQLVASLQVHVAVGDPQRTLAVYNALRSFLPELAALAANSPFHDGHDTGLASVRPTIAAIMPRQGIPPQLESWEAFTAELRWGAAAQLVAWPRAWWWELRPHLAYGTLELRSPDAQTTLAEVAGVAALAQALVAWLASRWDAGEALAVVPSWRIEENRFLALQHGVEGTLADLESGRREPARARLERLIEELEPAAARLGSAPLLAHARALVERNGAIRQREVAAERGLHGLVGWLADRFADPLPGA